MAPTTLIMDLERWFRCRECDARGKAIVSISGGMGVEREGKPTAESLLDGRSRHQDADCQTTPIPSLANNLRAAFLWNSGSSFRPGCKGPFESGASQYAGGPQKSGPSGKGRAASSPGKCQPTGVGRHGWRRDECPF